MKIIVVVLVLMCNFSENLGEAWIPPPEIGSNIVPCEKNNGECRRNGQLNGAYRCKEFRKPHKYGYV